MRLHRTDLPGGIARVAIEGELDTWQLEQFSHAVESAIGDGRVRLMLNMSRLRQINSSGLGYLVQLRRMLHERQGELVLTEPSGYFTDTLATLGLDEIFSIYADDGAAIEHFESDGEDPAGAPPPLR